MRLRSALPIRTKIASLHHRYNIRSLLGTPWYSRENLWSSNGRLSPKGQETSYVLLWSWAMGFYPSLLELFTFNNHLLLRSIYYQMPCFIDIHEEPVLNPFIQNM